MAHVDTAKRTARLTLERLRLAQVQAQEQVLAKRLAKVQTKLANKIELIKTLELGLSSASNTTTSSNT